MGDGVVEVGERRGAGVDHVLDRVEGQVRVDGSGAVPEQQGEVVHLPRLAGLDDEADLGPRLLTDHVVVDRRGGEEHRDRRQILVRQPVRQHDDVDAVLDRLGHLAPQAVECPPQAVAPGEHRIEAANRAGLELRVDLLDVLDPVECLVVEDRVGQLQQVARVRAGIEDVSLGPDHLRERRHQLFADGVEGRVGHLGEQLLEVVVEEPRATREDRDGCVGAHRPEGLDAVARHRLDQDAKVLVGVPERLLLAEHVALRLGDVEHLGQVVEVQELLAEPLAVRMGVRKVTLDLVVGDDAALRRCRSGTCGRDGGGPSR